MIDLKVRITKRERRKDLEVFHLLGHSPNDLLGQNWVDVKLGVRSF